MAMPIQVVECATQFESFELYDDRAKSTFCTINYCLVEDLQEEGAPMSEGHSIQSDAAVVAVDGSVDVTCLDGYWPYVWFRVRSGPVRSSGVVWCGVVWCGVVWPVTSVV